MTVPRFLVGSDVLASASTVLTGTELHHLRVRRLRVGSDVILCDGLGHERYGVVTALDRMQARIQFTEKAPVRRESPLHLVLAQAALKGHTLDLVIEKATELGVSEMIVFTCERSQGHPSVAREARWTRLARSAAKQCQRSTVPAVRGPLTFDDVLGTTPDALRLLLWENAFTGGLQALARRPPHCTSVLVVVGPEGGFTNSEAERAAAVGFELIGIGGRVLRAETASIVAVTLSQFLWGDLGAEPC